MSYWDEPGIAIVSDYVKFENVGDTISGVIIDLGIQTWQDGSKSPKLTLRTADGDKVLTASQVQLKQKMAELRPEVGAVELLSQALVGLVEDRTLLRPGRRAVVTAP